MLKSLQLRFKERSWSAAHIPELNRVLVLAVATFAALWFVIQLWPVLLLLLVATIFMVGLLPGVEALVRRRVPRSLAVIAILMAILALTVALFSFLVPALIREIKDVRDNLPDSAREVEDLARTLHGERYLREQQARTELARINRELKQLSAQLAALKERRAALLSEFGEQGSPRQ